ncbi:MAG: hypothetical protein HQL72_13770 [Magnetococcales bacterium]|nr:hypothetical protein [Magnetococcales bacterium]
MILNREKTPGQSSRVSGSLLCLVLLLGAATFSSSAQAEEADKVIEALGAVNGVALHCNRPNQVRKIKGAMVGLVPKLPEYRESFFSATNDAFLRAARTQESCPDPIAFRATVQHAIDQLQHFFQPGR